MTKTGEKCPFKTREKVPWHRHAMARSWIWQDSRCVLWILLWSYPDFYTANQKVPYIRHIMLFLNLVTRTVWLSIGKEPRFPFIATLHLTQSPGKVTLADLCCQKKWSLSKRTSLLGIPATTNQSDMIQFSSFKGHLWFPLNLQSNLATWNSTVSEERLQLMVLFLHFWCFFQ